MTIKSLFRMSFSWRLLGVYLNKWRESNSEKLLTKEISIVNEHSIN